MMLRPGGSPWRALHIESLDRGRVGDQHHRPLEAEEAEAEGVAVALAALLHEGQRPEGPAQRLDQRIARGFGRQRHVPKDRTDRAARWSAAGMVSIALMTTRRRAQAPLLRQGARDLRVGRRPADGRLRPDLDLRRGDADADHRQGQGAEPDVGLLVRADRGHRPQPLHLRGRAGGGRRTGDAGAAAGDVPGRVRRPRLPLGLGLEGIPRVRRRLRDRAAGRA